MRARFLEPAEQELDEAYAYYEYQQDGLGERFVQEIVNTIDRIKTFPQAWTPLSSNTRRCIARMFPYSVIYQIREDCVLIVAIANLRQKPFYWGDRLDLDEKNDG